MSPVRRAAQTGVFGLRRPVLILLAPILLATAPAAADPGTLTVTPLLRPTAGRPTAAIVSGHLRGAQALYPREVAIEGGAAVVTLEVRRQGLGPEGEHPYAYRVELPPLPEGAVPLRLESRSGAEGPVAEAFFFLGVRSAIAAGLEPAGEGKLRIWIAGTRPAFLFEGKPQVSGTTIRAVVSGAWCDLGGCPPPAPPAFRSTSEEIGPLPAGVYTLELLSDDPPFDRRPIFLTWRSREQVLDGPVRVRNGRFEIAVELDPPHAATPRLVMPPTADSALFHFFSPDNWEAMVKVLDGCAINGRFWVFAAASTDVGYTLRITDIATGGTKEYRHDAGTPAPALTDIQAFPCEEAS